MAESRLDILITASNGAKANLDAVLSQLNSIAKAVGAVDGSSVAGVSKNLSSMGAEASKSATHVNSLAANMAGLHTIASKLVSTLKFVTGGFLAFEGGEVLKHMIDTAARAQVLETVLIQVGNTAGISTDKLKKTDEEVQKLGITAESSRESLAKLIQAGLNLSLAAPLARAAQDLAVVAGWNSSETFQRLIVQIQQMDSLGLRFMGIIVNREQVFAKASAEVGGALTQQMKQLVFAQAVLQQSAKLQGVYENSLHNVAKQLTTLPRLYDELNESMGKKFLPLYSSAIRLYSTFLDLLIETSNASNKAQGATLGYVGILGVLRDIVEGLISGLKAMKEAFEAIAGTSTDVLTAITSLGIALALYKWTALSTAFTVIATTSKVAGVALLSFRTNVLAVTASSGAGAAAMWALSVGLNAVQTAAYAATTALIAFGRATIIIGAVTLAINGVISLYDKLKISMAETAAPSALKEYLRNLDIQAEKVRAINIVLEKSQALERKIQDLKDKGKPKEAKALQLQLDTINAEKLSLERENKALANKIADLDEKLTLGAKGLSVKEEQQRKTADNKKAELAESLKDLEAGKTAVDTSLQALGEDLTSITTGVGVKFREEIDKIGTAVEAMGVQVANVPLSDAELVKFVESVSLQFVKQAGNVKNAAELFALEEGLISFHNGRMFQLYSNSKTINENYTDDVAKSLAFRNYAIKLAEGNAKAAQAKAKGDAVATAEEAAKASASANYATTKRNADKELALIAQNRKALDREYKLNLLSIEAYYDKVASLIRRKSSQEILILQANETRLRRELSLAKSDGKVAANSALQDAIAATAQAKIAQKNSLKDNSNDREDAETAYTAARHKDSQELLTLTGRDIQAKRDALAVQHALDVQVLASDALHLADINKTFKIKNDLLDLDQKDLDLKNKILYIDQAEYELQQKLNRGAISGADGEEQRTTILQNRVAIQKQELDVIDARLRLQKNDLPLLQAKADLENKIKNDEYDIAHKAQRIATAAIADQQVLNAQLESRLSLQQSEIALANKLGLITDLEAQVQINDIIRQRIEERQVELDLQQQLLDKIIGNGVEEQRQRLEAQKRVEEITGQINDLRGQYESLSIEIRKTFTGSLATGIQGIIEHTNSLKEAWNGVLDSITKTINAAASKELAGQITKVVIDITKGSDGNSVFDFLGNMFGNKPDGSTTHPFTVVMQNLADLGGLLGVSGGGGFLSGVGSGIASIFGSDGTYAGGGGFFDGITNWLNGFADGGVITGAGTGTSDSIPIMGSAGEYIMTAVQTKQWLPALEMMRQGRFGDYLAGRIGSVTPYMPSVPRYATGGLVTQHAGAAQGGGGGRSNVYMTINTPDANSFRRSQDQIAAETGMAVNRAMRRNR